jgi:pimeloyl-ACP methyl ester carboxylesterase
VTETRWLLRGLEFAALEWGERVGRPTILLHGYLDHAGAWSRVAEALPGWRLALDQRGHGRSPHQDSGTTYHFPEYLADLDALVDRTGPAVLVGQSMGGTVASMYAGARPDRVAGLVIIDGLGLPDASQHAADRVVDFLDGVAHPPVAKVFPSLAAAAARLRHSNPFLDEAWALELAERGTVATNGGRTWSFDPVHRVRGALPYQQDRHRQLLSRVRCPVLCIRPELSPFSPADVEAVASAIVDRRNLDLPGVGHMAHLQAPGEVASAVAAFLASLP